MFIMIGLFAYNLAMVTDVEGPSIEVISKNFITISLKSLRLMSLFYYHRLFYFLFLPQTFIFFIIPCLYRVHNVWLDCKGLTHTYPISIFY